MLVSAPVMPMVAIAAAVAIATVLVATAGGVVNYQCAIAIVKVVVDVATVVVAARS